MLQLFIAVVGVFHSGVPNSTFADVSFDACDKLITFESRAVFVSERVHWTGIARIDSVSTVGNYSFDRHFAINFNATIARHEIRTYAFGIQRYQREQVESFALFDFRGDASSVAGINDSAGVSGNIAFTRYLIHLEDTIYWGLHKSTRCFPAVGSCRHNIISRQRYIYWGATQIYSFYSYRCSLYCGHKKFATHHTFILAVVGAVGKMKAPGNGFHFVGAILREDTIVGTAIVIGIVGVVRVAAFCTEVIFCNAALDAEAPFGVGDGGDDEEGNYEESG